MGTQQILQIVLAVIIVGTAVLVGIGMFSRQSLTTHQRGIISQMHTYVVDAVAYKKTSRTLGGGNGSFWGYTPSGAEAYNRHVGSPANYGIRIVTPEVNYFIEFWAEGSYPQRIKIIASSKLYGEGNYWTNTYNARITANYDAAGQLIRHATNANLKGYMFSGNWTK